MRDQLVVRLRRLGLGAVSAACVVGGALVLPAGAATPAADAGASLEFFEKKIRPLLVDNCYNCHSADTNAKGGLRVDDRGGLLSGGNSGPAVVPGAPDKSLLIKAVRYDNDDLQMPPKKQLSADQVADLERWVKEGAVWPKLEVAVSDAKSSAKYERLRKEHWAWQPLRESKPPAVRDASWIKDDVDAFVLAKLEEKGLKPSGRADKLALIRRVTFDLTGLPPTPEEVEAFVRDDSAGAYAQVVDRLLASPAFGERWGRHWLDVARYGESTGSSRNVPYPHAWRYRDYVIDAFNADKPFDQFVREQVAGDLLPSASQKERDERLVATGFLALGVKDVNQRFKVRFVMDNVDEQIDTVTRSVVGLTVSCARCHDHKFDPIPQADYYALAGIFRSTDLCAGVRNKMGGGGLDYYDSEMLVRLSTNKPAPPAEQVAALKEKLDKATAEWNAIRGTPAGLKPGPNGQPTQRPYRLRMDAARAEYLALTDPAAQGEVALGARDAKEVADTELRVRGEAEKLGPVVPRGYLSTFAVPGAPEVNREQSGRLELAQWLTSDKNPLTARVFVNRAWQYLFGQGLVKSVDNFGVTGDVPSHPELLDHLAGRFVRGAWSVKKLVRAVVLSRAYQLSSEAAPENLAVDPENRLVWRHAPRRLEAEEIRDAALVAAGTLDPARPAGSPAKELPVREIRNNGPEARRFGELASASRHRSVYLPLLRGLVPTSLEVFDFAEQGMVTGSRDATTVSTQALYMLNDPFVRRQSLALAEKLLVRSELTDRERVDLAYRLTVGRPSTDAEVARAARFVEEYASAAGETWDAAQLASADAVAASAGNTAEATDAKTPPPVNADQVVAVEEPVKEEVVRARDAKTAAWASFVQALFGSAEFRYLK